ncbi:MAG: sigma 54-interacting transcriptional regulator, partial [Candidatus Angelobacter sp.]
MPYPTSGHPLTNLPDDENAPAATSSGADSELIIRSPSLQRVMKLAEKVARHPAAVLIVGETGSGKE